MKELKNTFEFSAIVGNFDDLRKSLNEYLCDAVFHAGMLPYVRKELENLCKEYKENLTIYDDNGTSIYYFRFSENEYYEDIPFALSLKELRKRVEDLINSKVYTKEEIEGLNKKNINKLEILYKVNLHIHKVDVNRNENSETHEYIYASGNFILDRRNAITKAKEILKTIDDYLPEGEHFSSRKEAGLLDFRNFNYYGLSICFSDSEYNQIDNDIFRDSDNQYKMLEDELKIFRTKYPSIKSTKTENFDDELVEVLEEDLDFLLESS